MSSTTQRVAAIALRSTPARPIPAMRLVAAIDVATILLTFLSVLVGVNLGRMADGLDSFLAIRVTLKNVLVVGYLTAGALTVFRAVGLYDASRLRRWWHEAHRVLLATTLITTIATIAPLTSQSGAVDWWALLWFWAGTTAALLVTRGVRSQLARATRERRRVIIVGTGPLALRIYRELCADVLTPCHVVGFVDDTGAQSSPFLERRTLGTLDQLEEVLVREHVDEVYVGLPVKSHLSTDSGDDSRLRAPRREGDVSRRHLRHGARAAAHRRPRPMHAARAAAHGARTARASSSSALVDIVGASVALVLLCPVMLAAALAIRLTSRRRRSSIAQERYGLNRRRFRMYKFRTMVADADRLQASLESRNEATGPVFKIAQRSARSRRVGRFLRRTLDRRAAAVVQRAARRHVAGRPAAAAAARRRPLHPHRRSAALQRASRRHLSVAGQRTQQHCASTNGSSWICSYIDQWSLGLDFLILARTVPAVLRGTGAQLGPAARLHTSYS